MYICSHVPRDSITEQYVASENYNILPYDGVSIELKPNLTYSQNTHEGCLEFSILIGNGLSKN